MARQNPPLQQWTIRIVDGPQLPGLSESDIVEGLRTGWLSLDDDIAKGPGMGLTLGTATTGLPFGIRAFSSPILVHTTNALPIAAAPVAALWLMSAWVNLGVVALGLDTPRAIGLSIGVLVYLLGCATALATLPVGIVVFLGLQFLFIPLLAALVGVHPLQITDTFINFGTMLGSGIALGTGALIGGIIGAVVGAAVGLARRSRYTVPKSRSPIPAVHAPAAAELDATSGPRV